LDCLFDQDYSRLIISGNPHPIELVKSWNKIYSEYVGMVSEGKHNEFLEKIIDINEISAKVFLCEKSIEFLTFNYDAEINKVLNEYGLQTGITENDTIPERCKKLEIVHNRMKRWVIQQQLLQNEFNELQKNRTEQDGGEYYFDNALDSLSQYRQYSVRAEDISVHNFVWGLKNMEKHLQKLKSKADGRS
jgi:hypothetical protein